MSDETPGREEDAPDDAPPPKRSREELLAAIGRPDDLTLDDLVQAIRAGRLTEAEANELVPTLRAVKQSLVSSMLPIADLVRNLNAVQLQQPKWAAALSEVAARAAPPPVPRLAPRPELDLLAGVQAEIANLATLLTTTGEEIASMAQVARAGLEGLSRLEGIAAETREESAKLRTALIEGQKAAKRSARVLNGLTFTLVVLTMAVTALTGVLIARR